MAVSAAQKPKPGAGVRTWHLPVFFLGVATLVAVLLARPWLSRGTEGRQIERHLSEARRLLDEKEIDLAQVLELTQSARDGVERAPQAAGEGFFLSGSAYLRMAERDSTTPLSENARLAATHLERAETLGVPNTDRAKLSYRLGKAWYLTNHEPRGIIDHWKDAIAEGADDPAEAYELLSHIYLRLPEPDLEAALAANGKLLQLPLDADTVLAPARLFRGELLLRLHQPDAARDVLKKIGANAPPGLAAQARFLRAGCLEDEGHWAEALKLWEEALADKAAPAKQPELARYHVGWCHLKLDESVEAAKAWEECLRGPNPGDAGPAAALRLAGVHLLKEHNAQSALEAYSRAIRDAKGPADWHNSIISLSALREEFESGCLILRQTGQYSLAIQLANLYDKFAPAGKAHGLRGAAASQWALAHTKAASRAGLPTTDSSAHVPATERSALEEEARSQYRKAGEAYAKAADETTVPADQADRLWLSAKCYMDGQDAARAAPILERFLKLDQPGERAGEAWFLLAEAQGALHKEAEQLAAYKKSSECPGRFAAKARYQMALAAMAKGELAVAETLLEENDDPANHDVDKETKEQSLFALGNVHLQRRSLQSAILRLEQALRDYPKGAEVNQARYQLAECFRLLAQQAADARDEAILDATREFSNKQFRVYLGKAVSQYQELADSLSGRASSQRMSKEEEEVCRVASFASADGRFRLGQYEDACKLYEGLAARYHDQIHSLHALSGVARCSWARNDNKKAAIAIQSLDKALRELDDSQFPKESGAWDRKKWESWIKEKSKPAEQP